MQQQSWEESEKRGYAERRYTRSIVFFLAMFGVSGGLKSRLAKAAGAEPSGGMSVQRVHAAVARRISKSTC